MKITVFTRVYNAEKYIEKCIESVLHQTFRDFEYYIVDNGSTDSTGQKLDKLAKTDTRIRLFHLKENSRNVLPSNIKNYRGIYFTVIDADDWWEKNYLEIMIALLEKENLDLAVTGTMTFYESDNTKEIMRRLDKPLILTQREFAQQYMYYWGFPSTYWGSIMKTELLRRTEFPEGVYTYGGDTINMLSYIMQCDRIGIDDSVLYNYRIHNSNVSYEYDKNRFVSNVYLIECIIDFLKKNDAYDTNKSEWLKMVFSNSIRMTAETLANSKLTSSEKINELKRIVEHPLTINALNLNCPDTQHTRDTLLSVLFKNAANQATFKKVLDILTPKCTSAINIEEIPLIYTKTELANALISDDPDALLVALLDMIANNELTKKYDIYSMVRSLSLNKPLLRDIDDKKFLRRYGNIYIAVWRGLYKNALDMMTTLLQKREKADNVFLQLYLNLSALLGRTDEFLYGKVCSAGYHLYCKKYDECRNELNDLTEMGVEDNDEIIRIKRELEKVGK